MYALGTLFMLTKCRILNINWESFLAALQRYYSGLIDVLVTLMTRSDCYVSAELPAKPASVYV